MAKKTYNGVTYDDSVDYSVEIEKAKAAGQDTTALVASRNAKIADKYGGNEPTMYGSDKTYNQLSGSNANWQNQGTVRNAMNTAMAPSLSGVMQQMEQAAQSGNWDLAGSLSNQLLTPDGYYGGYHAGFATDYLNQLSEKYGYDANKYYQGLYDSVYGAGAWDGGTGTGKPVYNDFSDALVQLYNSMQGGTPGITGGTGSVDPSSLLSLVNLAGSFNSGKAPQWNGSEWDSVLDSMVDKLLNSSFEEWMQGDQYKALADKYGEQGRMSMQDVMGQIAGRTGGLASSYAATAANQQYNGFMDELMTAAMEMYGLDQNELMDNIQMVQGFQQDDYNQFLNNLDQWNADRNFNYNAWQDQQGLLADKAAMLASAGDFSGYKALGYSDAEIALLQQAMMNEQQAQDAGKKTGGGGAFNNGSVTPDNIQAMQRALGVTADGKWGKDSKAAAKKAGWSTDPDDAWAAYGGSGVTPDKTGGNNDYWLGDGSTAGGKTSLNWDQDEGIFTWNGQNYYDVESLLTAIEDAGLTDSEMTALQKKFKLFGFNLA